MSRQFQNQLFKNPIFCSYCLFIITPIILVSLSHLLNTLWGKELSWKLTQSEFKIRVLELTCLLSHSSSQQTVTVGKAMSGVPLEPGAHLLPPPNVTTTQMSPDMTKCPGGGYQNCPWFRTTELEKIELLTVSSRRDRVPALPLWMQLPRSSPCHPVHTVHCRFWPTCGHSCLHPMTACTRNALQAWAQRTLTTPWRWTLLWILIYK